MTAPTEKIQNVREGRHLAKIALAKAFEALEGRQGLTQEEQAELLATALQATNEAQVALQATATLAQERDFEAHQEAKEEPPPVGHLYFLAAEEEAAEV